MIETVERLNNQAIILAKDGSFKEAIACFARAITIEKDNSLLWYNLALTYRDAGQLKEAKDALFKAKDISPDDQEILEELSPKFEGEIKICKCNVDENPELASEFGVMTIPNLVFFKNGNKVGQYSGVMQEAGIRRMFEN